LKGEKLRMRAKGRRKKKSICGVLTGRDMGIITKQDREVTKKKQKKEKGEQGEKSGLGATQFLRG